jgi:hypothetical protein
VELLMITERFRVRPGKLVSLDKYDPEDTKPF